MWATSYQSKPQNRANLSSSYTIQQKLKIGKPGDKYEQEADRVADAVMRMPDSQVLRQPLEEEEEKMQMQPLEEEEELQMQPVEEEELQMKRQKSGLHQMCPSCRERFMQGKPLDCPECSKKLQMKPSLQHQYKGPTYASPEIDRQLETSKGSGKPLSLGVQREMSHKMGVDFSGVRVHTNSTSHQLSRQLGARAFTHGSDIYFNEGEYSPTSDSGKCLLAHELTHVVQQSQNTEIDTNPIQCACGRAGINDEAECIGRGGDIYDFGSSSVNIYLFIRNCDDFQPAEEDRLRDLAASIGPDDTLEIDGFASEEGPEDFNRGLSCARAYRAVYFLLNEGIASSQITGIYEHGATPGSRPDRRSVVINVHRVIPQEEESQVAPTTTYVACYDGRTVYAIKNGRTHQCAAVTGTSGAPTPDGEYCIREQGAAQLGWRPWRDHSSWYLLEPQFSTSRSRMHLHPGSISEGCVTVTNETCFSELASILNGSGRITRNGYDGYPPGNGEGVSNPEEPKTCVGLLLVDTSNAGSCNAAISSEE
jgi:outer membrane protein OmpA-like peptidoglycan-associated protein